ncbi:hypothetical protein [Antrihabitans spumae]|uniref:Uncharacterized protein n=1 Tax=Antrihabitans spumae TaxID=3373370 RepID=A0ABW7JZG3_9NOCA
MISQLYKRTEADRLSNIGPGANTSPADSARALFELEGMDDRPPTVAVTSVTNPATGHIFIRSLRRRSSTTMAAAGHDTCIFEGTSLQFLRRVHDRPSEMIFVSQDFLQLPRPSTRSDGTYAIVTVRDEAMIPWLRASARVGSGIFAGLHTDQQFPDLVTVHTETDDGITMTSRVSHHADTVFATTCVLKDETAKRRGRVPERIVATTQPTPIKKWFATTYGALVTVFARSAVRDQPVRWTSEFVDETED